MEIADNAVIVFSGAQLKAFVEQLKGGRESGPSVTLEEARIYLGISYATAYRKRKALGAYQLTPGGTWHVDRKDMYGYKEKMKRESERGLKAANVEKSSGA